MLRQLMAGMFLAIGIGIVSVGTAQPAGACSCATTSDAEAIGHADAAFAGSLVDVVTNTGEGLRSSSDPERFVFDVESVFKGEVAERQTVVTPEGGESCGLEIAGPGPYLVFAFDDSDLTFGAEAGELYSHLCSGTRALASGEVPVDFRATAPETTGNAPAPPDPGTESGIAAADDGGSELWIPVAVAAAALVLVLAAVSRHRAGARRGPPT